MSPRLRRARNTMDHVIRRSLKDLGILDYVPDAKVLYNDQFVPVRF